MVNNTTITDSQSEPSHHEGLAGPADYVPHVLTDDEIRDQ